MTTVVLTKNKDSYTGTQAILNPLKHKLEAKVKNINSLLIKINFVTSEYELATTPFQSVLSFVHFIKSFYKQKIIIAEEASIGNTKEGFIKYGFAKLAKQDRQVDLLDSATDKVKLVKLNYPHGTLKLPIAQSYRKSPFIVSITRAKTHDSVVVTLGIKNLLVGAIQGGIPQRVNIHKGMDIHPILAALAKQIYPDLVIIDGVIGMEGNGPDKGSPKKAGWLVSSFDALAADSLATYLMGFDIKNLGYLNLIHQENLGLLFPQNKIKIIGPNPDTIVTPFKPHHIFKSQCLWH